MAEIVGGRIGPYRIDGPVGTGGFATVYRARDERFDQDVAVKVLAENHSLDPAVRERFLGEARLLRRLDSPFVVRVLDIGETERLQPYLVLTYADRGDLRHRVEELRRHGHEVSDADLEAVVRALAAALRLMHPLGIVHRDISPGNMLIVSTDPESTDGGPDTADGHRPPAERVVADDERLVLADLGYAKDLAVHSGLTIGGGTRGFQAPEQQAGLGRIDATADIYGASAVMAWLVTGTDPDGFRSSDPETELRHRGARPQLAAALATGLALEPHRRQPDVDRWERAILTALGPSPGHTPDPGTGTPTTAVPSTRPVGRLRTVAVAVVIAMFGVVAGFGLSLSLSGSSPDVTRLEDGRVRVSATDGPLSVAVFGPDRLGVGEAGTFEAGIVGAVDYRWIAPNGDILTRAPSIVVTATSPGTATVTLVATGADGTVLTVAHQFVADS